MLEFLLQGEWDGAAALRSQLKTAIHVKSSSETAAFEIAVADDAPRAPQTVRVEQGELYVRVENGTLVGLGCAQTVTKLPPLAELFAA